MYSAVQSGLITSPLGFFQAAAVINRPKNTACDRDKIETAIVKKKSQGKAEAFVLSH